MFTTIYLLTFLFGCLPVAWALAQRNPSSRTWVWLGTAALGLASLPLAQWLYNALLARMPATTAGTRSLGVEILAAMLVAVAVCTPLGLLGKLLLRRSP
jgi:drug/metabolite transporter (DMT)-like permease